MEVKEDKGNITISLQKDFLKDVVRKIDSGTWVLGFTILIPVFGLCACYQMWWKGKKVNQVEMVGNDDIPETYHQFALQRQQNPTSFNPCRAMLKVQQTAELRDCILNIPKNLMCSICLSAFEDPMTILCGHSFCYPCLNYYQDVACPLCKHPYRRRDAVPSVIIKQMVQDLPAKCPDCAWIGPFYDLRNHMIAYCAQKVPILVPPEEVEKL